MKKINLSFLTCILFLILQTQNAIAYCPHCQTEASFYIADPSLKAAAGRLEQLPESRRVIKEALKEGSITLEMTYEGMPFEAMWVSGGGTRKIVLDGRAHQDPGIILRHLLFELTNAISESKYQELAQLAQKGRIDCDSYVEEIEKTEHHNMIQVVKIIEKGIAAGLFPPSARWTMIDDFSVHYKIQQLVGHSLHLAEEYQDITRQRGFSSYQGTVKNLKNMSKKEKLSLAAMLYRSYFKNADFNEEIFSVGEVRRSKETTCGW